MNTTARLYAMKRISDILGEKSKALKEGFTKAAKSISEGERARLIREGKVKLKASVRGINCYLYVMQAFDFSEYEWPATTDQKAFEKALKPFAREAKRIEDTLMLGDSSAALEAIEKFAKMCAD